MNSPNPVSLPNRKYNRKKDCKNNVYCRFYRIETAFNRNNRSNRFRNKRYFCNNRRSRKYRCLHNRCY